MCSRISEGREGQCSLCKLKEVLFEMVFFVLSLSAASPTRSVFAYHEFFSLLLELRDQSFHTHCVMENHHKRKESFPTIPRALFAHSSSGFLRVE